MRGRVSIINKPRRIRKGEAGYGRKKFTVTVQRGDTKKTIKYGDANMEIKKDNPKNRANFRSRHNCDTAKDKMTARYWSCRNW